MTRFIVLKKIGRYEPGDILREIASSDSALPEVYHFSVAMLILSGHLAIAGTGASRPKKSGPVGHC